MSNKCDSCGIENRDIAKYCKSCGTKLAKSAGINLDDLVGAESIKNEIKALLEISKAMSASGIDPSKSINKHTIIMGKTGTGKSTIVNVLQQIFYENGIIKKDEAKILDAVDYPPFTKDFEKNISKVKDGILFIDNVHMLISGKDDSDIHSLSKLFSEMDKFGYNPIIILAGQQEEFEDFLNKNPQIKNRFEYQFKLLDFSADELLKICYGKLKESGLSLSDDAEKRLKSLFKYQVKIKDETFGNGHYAVHKAEEIIKTYYLRTKGTDDQKQVKPEDILGHVPEEKSVEQVINELDQFVGMTEVKQAVREMAERIKVQQERFAIDGSSSEKIGANIILTGNPGTGKTTVARKLGAIFEAIGFLDRGHVIEVDRGKIVSKYANESIEKMNEACDEAMGGILFIDEAYTLTPPVDSGTSNKAGKQAVEALMKRMEDDRGKFAVIAAGYKDEMQNFLTINPGMQSRVDRFIHIEDYTPDELYQIYLKFLEQDKYKLADDAQEKLKRAVQDIYNKRDKSFANAREMRKLYDDTKNKISLRISALPPNEKTKEVYRTVLAEDIPYEPPKAVTVDELLAELNELIGLDNVKNEIKKLAAYLKFEKQRQGEDGQVEPIAKHYVFSGNPGTGKTTVARLLGKIFKALEILPTDKIIEADRSKLIGQFAGTTDKKTHALIDKAFGGILFIDEAYTLNQGSRDNYGKQAIDTLLKRVEDDKGKFICILAGYTNEMRQLLDTNPGLRSRFNTTIHFEDYKPEELDAIFKSMVKKIGFKLDEKAEENSINIFRDLYLSKDKNFGNARTVKNIFDNARENQSERLNKLAEQRKVTQEELSTFTLEDIQGEVKDIKTLDQVLSELDEFVGMKNVKDTIKEIANEIQMMQRRVEQGLAKPKKIGKHIILTGNPGTGKTTLVRKLGEIFKAIRLLSSDKVVEVDRSKIVSKYANESAEKMNDFCDQAMGGILFIDEAYTLAPDIDSGSSDKGGTEAIETLMKRMEDDRGKFVVVAAGYRIPMQRFINVNDGINSRFDIKLHIEDYEPEELFEIFKIMAKKENYIIKPEAEDKIFAACKDLYDRRLKNFANAREVRSLFDKTTNKLDSRINNKPDSDVTKEDMMTITEADIPFEEEKEQSVEDIFGELNDLIGLDSVKDNLKQLAEFVKLEKMRAAEGGKSTVLNLHYVFSGNPGTGKTTVARLLGKIFKSLGILSRGHLVEADRSKFIGQYKGTTDKKTHALIDGAQGGLLFIDEAYTLVQGSQDDFGQTAISTLLTRLENDKGKFIAIIAGYTDKMEYFLDQNEGLPSRFPNRIEFPDYKPDELSAIFRLFVKKKNMKLSEDAEQNIDQFFKDYYDNRDKYFGNARDVRNIFERALQKQGTRLAKMPTGTLTTDDINTLKFEDIKL